MSVVLLQLLLIGALLTHSRYGRWNNSRGSGLRSMVNCRVSAGIAGCLILSGLQYTLSVFWGGNVQSSELNTLSIFTFCGIAGILIPSIVLAAREDNPKSLNGEFSFQVNNPGKCLSVLLVAVSSCLFARLYLSQIQGPDIAAISPNGARLPGTRLEMILLAGFIAPVVEEVLFRGFVFRGLYRANRSLTAAVLSALTFALFHPTEIALPVFVLGLGCALVYEHCRTLFAPMMVHSIYNISQLI
jgi:membrane protease YdiL (CAAX protease family)